MVMNIRPDRGWRVTPKKPVHRGTAAGLAAGHAAVRQALEAAGIRRHYRNYPDPRLADWQGAYFPGVYERLQKLKAVLDPEDRFRHPQSVRLPKI